MKRNHIFDTQVSTLHGKSLVTGGDVTLDLNFENIGITIKKSFSNIDVFESTKNNYTWSEGDVVHIGEMLKPVTIDYYVAPYGNDTTGDGSYNNPFKTFTRIPLGCTVALKEGDYKSSEYGITIAGGVTEIHGLFKGLHGYNETKDTFFPSKKLTTENKEILLKYSTNFTSIDSVTYITKENKNASVNIMFDKLDGTGRDKNIVSLSSSPNDLVVFKDLNFSRKVGNIANYSSAIVSTSGNNKAVFEDCVFDFLNSTYSYVYNCIAALFNRCKFYNGTLVGNYSGTSVVKETNELNIEKQFLTYLTTSFKIWNDTDKEFLPFNFLRIDNLKNEIKLQGLSEIPSPELNVEKLTCYRHPVTKKPIYSKTINFGALPNNTTKVVAHGIIKPEDIQINYGLSYVVSTINSKSYGLTVTSTAFSAQWNTGIDKTNIEFWAGSDRTAFKAYIVVEYTKTTDTENSPVALVGNTNNNLVDANGVVYKLGVETDGRLVTISY